MRIAIFLIVGAALAYLVGLVRAVWYVFNYVIDGRGEDDD